MAIQNVLKMGSPSLMQPSAQVTDVTHPTLAELLINLADTMHDKQGVAIAEDFHVRVVQHELDHLDVILYPYRIKDLHHFGYEDTIHWQK